VPWVASASRSEEAAIIPRNLPDAPLSTLRDVEARLGAYRIDAYYLLSLLLKNIAEDLGFTSNERISLYKPTAGKFFIIGRYSPHAEFNKRHRTYYPGGQGVIHQAWQVGWCEAKIKTSPNKLTRYTSEIENKFSIPAATVKSMAMKSRLYKAIALAEPKTGERMAILCIESTVQSAFPNVNQGDLEARCRPLVLLLEALEPHIVSLDDVLAEGY
jgi:hypothetical protein